LNLAYGSFPTHAVMAQVGGANAVQAEKKGLRVTQSPGGADFRMETSCPEPAQQARFRTTLKGSLQRQRLLSLQIPAEDSAREQQGHWPGQGFNQLSVAGDALFEEGVPVG
jgi:hypothetical protein